MKLHHRIMHRVKEHVQKHHKKYIFGLGMWVWMGLVKVVLVTVLALEIFHFAQGSNANYQQQTLASSINNLENQMDQLLNLHMDAMIAQKMPFQKDQIKIFADIESGYMSAYDTLGKYQWGIKLNAFAHQMDDYMHANWLIVTPEDISMDQEYHAVSDQLTLFIIQEQESRYLLIFKNIGEVMDNITKIVMQDPWINTQFSWDVSQFAALHTVYNDAQGLAAQYQAAKQLYAFFNQLNVKLNQTKLIQNNPKYHDLNIEFHVLNTLLDATIK